MFIFLSFFFFKHIVIPNKLLFRLSNLKQLWYGELVDWLHLFIPNYEHVSDHPKASHMYMIYTVIICQLKSYKWLWVGG